jgi:O-antigen/teichoic acid export membrane protein
MALVSSFGRKEFFFTIGRYIVYALQITKGFALAYFLGPFFLGIYGYFMLYQQYLVYSNLGVQYALNAELSISVNSSEKVKDDIANSAFTLTGFISGVLVIAALVIYVFKINIFPYENSYKYILPLVLLTCMGHFQEIFINIFRINKTLLPIIYTEFFIALVTLVIIPFFSKIDLINAVLGAWVLALAISMGLYLFLYKKKIRYNTVFLKPLFQAGVPLLLFIFSYNLMGLIIRTLISLFYGTDIMGYFAFANSLTTAIMLSFNSITWLMYPAVIAKLGDPELKGSELQAYLISFSRKLSLIVFAIIGLAILVMPVLFIFLPQYAPVKGALTILLLNQVVFNAGFALVSLAIGRKFHFQIAGVSLISVVACFVCGLIFSYFHFSIEWLAIANLLGSLFFLNIFIFFIAKKFSLSYKALLSSFDPLIQVIIFFCCVAAVMGMQYLVILLIIAAVIIKRKDCNELIGQIRSKLKRAKQLPG